MDYMTIALLDMQIILKDIYNVGND